ncbi:MAG: hypothetical protein JNJ88_19055 [Planctomycetes bacterium]|nr:hypothetical protein [Planctomycetota bacterium]
MLFLPALASEPDPGPMWSFLTLFLVACAIARASSFAKRLRHGDSEHSYYTGRPAFAGLLRRIGEERVKGVIEPIIAMLAGTVMLEFNSTLGGYWLAAGLALAITVQMQLFRDRRRAMDMRDAYFDQQRVARRWRDQLQ